MGGIVSRSSGSKTTPLRNGADEEMWSHATSEKTVARLARLEAMAKVESTGAHVDEESVQHASNTINNGVRLAYSSVLAVKTREEARKLLAFIFTQALTKNPAKQIGGILFYDEETHAVVQVLEGPASNVRKLYNTISPDSRHTSVKKHAQCRSNLRVLQSLPPCRCDGSCMWTDAVGSLGTAGSGRWRLIRGCMRASG
jgi:hypothetical protein